MNTSPHKVLNQQRIVIMRCFAIMILCVLMHAAVADIAAAQAIPPRGYDTQVSRPLTAPPIPQIDRQVQALQQQIIDATDPKWGTVNVKKLKKRISTIPGPPGVDVGVQKLEKRRSTIPGPFDEVKPAPIQTRRSTIP